MALSAGVDQIVDGSGLGQQACPLNENDLDYP
jgi:hypothetical protein